MRFGLFGSAQADGSDLGAGIGQGLARLHRFQRPRVGPGSPANRETTVNRTVSVL
jgi:hypothetical protein